MLDEHDFDADAEASWEEWQARRAALHDDWVGDDPPPDDRAAHGFIDWAQFWAEDHDADDWLVEPFLARGRAHALYAPAKAGKSLLALEVAAATAAGREVLEQAAGSPRTVMYVDYEMTKRDLKERLVDFGYSPTDHLWRLHYTVAPEYAPLDTVQGGAMLVARAREIGAELVVIDTTARAISQEENSSDTINDLARYTFFPLKKAGITTLRTDHAGKDLSKGQRGTSAKNDDVDIVWQLTANDDGVTLRATHRRLAWVPEILKLTRTEGPLCHRPSTTAWPAGTKDTANRLDALAAPLDMTVRAAMKLLRDNGSGSKTDVVSAALKYRRNPRPG